MNREEIIRMAKEAGVDDVLTPQDAVVRFAALVAAAEREECARIVEEMHWRSDAYHAIRARGETK